MAGTVARRTRAALKATSSHSARPAVTPSSLPTRHFEDGASWESWLEEHHQQETASTGLWVKISKKDSGIASVTYDEAVDSALCFGWIDGQRRRHDDCHFLQRFTPRRRGSLWSRRNVDRVAALIAAERIRPAGQREVDAARADGRWDSAYAPASTICVPDDFAAALAKDSAAAAFFDGLAKSKRYSFLMRLETARRPDTRQKRIRQFVTLLAERKSL